MSNGQCPAIAMHHGDFPNTDASHRRLEYWLSTRSDKDLDEPLLSSAEVEKHNRAVGQSGRLPLSQWNLLEPFATLELESQLQERLQAIGQAVHSKKMVVGNGKPLPPRQQQLLKREAGSLRNLEQHAIWQVALEPIQMRCAPYDGALFDADGNMIYDRNACSTIREQEPFELLGQWKNGMQFVRTRYAFGFIKPGAARSPDIPERLRTAYMNAPTVWTPAKTPVQCNGHPAFVSRFTSLPQMEDGTVILAQQKQFCTGTPSTPFMRTDRPLTRRGFYQTVFQFLGSAYGFGGSANGLDCSRLVMSLFSTFHLYLPRNSNHQSQSGSFSIDVSEVSDLSQKLQYLDRADAQGIVALYFPGHIMLYLGRDKEGTPMAIHALGEYAKPCSPSQGKNQETVYQVGKVVVTDLSVGAGSTRKSFLERLTRIVVFGKADDPELLSLANHRSGEPPLLPTEKCEDSVRMRIFQSPRRLIAQESARLIATGSTPFPTGVLQIFSAQGAPIHTIQHQLGGPPFTWWTEFVPAEPGKYTAVLGDGDTIRACDQFTVGRYRSKKKTPDEPQPYWSNRWKWESDTENFFAAFIEQLFDFPRDADVSWHGLQPLLSDPSRNLLFNHLGQNEDLELNPAPDCADLPYFLRGYFAWKTGLPFGIRSCSRGKKGRPPSCSDFQTNAQEAPQNPELETDAQIFEQFASVVIGWNAHSASGRTPPASSDADFYPVALSREALLPGTIFADPYGHVLIISKWFAQSPGGYGILMAVDGQPDGTIGRRRFWRGDFLFDSATDSFGAGFKRFRPIVLTEEATESGPQRVPATLKNSELQPRSGFIAYSTEQYSLGTEGFYKKMEHLINPSPLQPEKLLQSRIDALYEAVKRRAQAIDNGEAYFATHGFTPIDMPEASKIFQTEGPWEDYSTPSRDMRLLIALDVVLATPDDVGNDPEHFGISDTSEIEQIVSSLRAQLAEKLESAQFEYTRSDHSKWTLTLEEVVQRVEALTTGYNPNDCPEYRWGAPKGSREASTCRGRAPVEQTARVEEYKGWFQGRRRPIFD